jgi:hypothetical protein
MHMNNMAGSVSPLDAGGLTSQGFDMAKDPDAYSKKEAKDRFLKALTAAVNTPPKPLKKAAKKVRVKRLKGKATK